MGREFLEGEFFGGPLLLEKTVSKTLTQELVSKIQASKIRFPEFGPKLGFPRRKIPSQRALRGILMPRGKNCRETIFSRSVAAQLPSPRGQFRKRGKNPLLWGRGNLGGILRDNLGEGNCEAKIAARQRGVNFFAARHQDVSQGPLGCALRRADTQTPTR